MRHFLFVFWALLLALPSAYAKIWTLSDSNIVVQLDDQTALLKVRDKRANKVWAQAPLQQVLAVKKVAQQGNELTLDLAGKFNFTAVVSLNKASEVEVSIRADQQSPLDELSYPSAFQAPDKKHYLLQTNSEGILIPVDDTKYPLENERIYWCGGGLAMAWMGMTDFEFKTGYMAILETPFDASLVPFRESGQVMFKPLWLSSMGKFSYERKIRYVFFDQGGYVAQAKKYRDYAWKKNEVITLKERRKQTPALDKMIGAVHMYLWNDAREVSFATEMKAAGINRAFVFWDPNHTPYPEIGYDNRLKELGYAAGAYDLYTDLHLQDHEKYPVDERGPLRFSRSQYPGMFDELALVAKDGETESNQFGHTISPKVIRGEIVKRIDRELKEYPHEAYFLDVYAANGVFEDYSPKHTLTRQQFAEEVIKNHQLIADKYKVFLGGEWGADYLAGNISFAHGMMTLQRTWWGTNIDKKGSINYAGDWKNGPSPTQMVGSRVANDAYLQYSINEYSRVPLYELVYHDAIVTSWRWEDASHHMPEIWWKKDLFNVLYGTVPLWSLDRNRWNEYKETFIASYNNIIPWLQKIGYDELLSHRFITRDHQVQESVFSSGKKVVVNFGIEDFSFNGKVIKGKSFETFE